MGGREEVEQMRAGEIKEQLFKRGISYAGLYEKSELVDKLVAAYAEQTAASVQDDNMSSALAKQLCQLGGFRTELMRLMAREGTLGANVRIDEKDYYAVKATFSDLKQEAYFILDTAASNSVCTPQWSQTTSAAPTGVTASVTGGTAGAGL
jgi:hypothetical protein